MCSCSVTPMVYFKLNALRNTHPGVLACNPPIKMQIWLLVGTRDKRPWMPSLWDDKGHENRWLQPGEWTTGNNSRSRWLPTFWIRRCQCDGWTQSGEAREEEKEERDWRPGGDYEVIKPRGFLGLRGLDVLGRALLSAGHVAELMRVVIL